MAKYRRIPVVVDATQWFPGVKIDGVREHHDCSRDDPAYEDSVDYAEVDTLAGNDQRVQEGDWVVTGAYDEKYIYEPDIFALVYEKVSD